jgi:hypothetical protein
VAQERVKSHLKVDLYAVAGEGKDQQRTVPKFSEEPRPLRQVEWTSWEEAVAETRHNWTDRPAPPTERVPTLQEVFSSGEDYATHWEGGLEAASRIVRLLGTLFTKGLTSKEAEALAGRIAKMNLGVEFEKSYRITWRGDDDEIYLNIVRVEPDSVQMAIHCPDKNLHQEIEALKLVEGS